MIATLQQIVEGALERLYFTSTTYLPPLLAAAIIVLGAWMMAVLARWLMFRIFKGTGFDRFLYQSGISSMLSRGGHLHATRLVAGAVYWTILGIGILTGLSAFNTRLTSNIIQTVVFLLPKLITAGFILLVGAWLAQYMGRSALVWAHNEGIPSPRRVAGAVHIGILFVAVVVAADHLDFARSVFLAAFILLVGGAILAASLALGLGARKAVEQHFHPEIPAIREPEEERSIWNHL